MKEKASAEVLPRGADINLSQVQALVHRKIFEREKCNHHREKTVKALLAIFRDFQKGFALKNGVKLISFSLIGEGPIMWLVTRKKKGSRS
jgi:hypothetical protein